MVLFTLSFSLGVWLLQQRAALPPVAWGWWLTAYPVVLTISERTVAQRAARTLSLAAFACGIGFFYAAWQGEQRLSVSLPDEWQGRDIIVLGVIAQLPHVDERGQRFRFDVEQTLTSGIQVPRHLYLSTYFDPPNRPMMHAGERWQLTVRLKQPHGSSNPYGADFELRALENDVRATGYVRNRENIPSGHLNVRLDRLADGLTYRIESWREDIRDKIAATLGRAPYTGILTALAIGDQASIPDAQWQLFRRTGVVHLMSISGLHITMLAGMIFAVTYWLWRQSARLTLWLPARKAAAFSAVMTAYGYAVLAGYGVPAQRTAIMVAAVAAALWLNRNFSLAQILCIAVLGVLIPDPWAILSPGFCLSFGAVALILYTTSHRVRFKDDAPHPEYGAIPVTLNAMRLLREYATVQWAMSLGLIPLLLALFWQVSLASPIANAIAIPLVSLVVVPLTLLGAALPTEVPLWLAHIVLHLTMVPLQYLSELPHAVWIQHAPPLWSIAAGMLGVLWLLLPAGFPARYLGGLLMLPMFLNTPEPPSPGDLRLIVFDVGQGLSVAAQTSNHVLLYDTGPDFPGEADSGNRMLAPSLRALGITSLDGLILSHDDLDHTGGTASILQNLPTNRIWASGSPGTSIPAERCRDGISWDWDGVVFEILHPAYDSNRSNDNSCVLRISTGSHHILLAGDIEKRSEQRLLKEHADKLPASLLVVPHHGSSGSSGMDFVAAVLPDYAVFTSGYRNRFGHPKAQILQRYLDSGATLLRSDQDGAILVSMNAQTITVERYRKTHRRYWTHVPKTD